MRSFGREPQRRTTVRKQLFSNSIYNKSRVHSIGKLDSIKCYLGILCVVLVVTLAVRLSTLLGSVPLHPANSYIPSLPLRLQAFDNITLAMRQLKSSQVFGSQGIHIAPNILCFKYTNDMERQHWGRPDKYVSCYVENACFNPLSNTLYIPHWDSKNIQIMDFDKGLDIVGTKEESLQNMVFERIQNPVFFLCRFNPENIYHDIVDSKIPIFANLLSSGLFDTETFSWKKEPLIYNYRLTETKTTPFDSLLKYITSSTTVSSSNLPTTSICIDKLYLGTNAAVRVDMRGNFDRPDSPSKPFNQSMLFSRVIVANIVDELLPNYKDNLIVNHVANRTNYYDLSIWMATMERNFLWPLSLNGEPHNGTHIVILKRVSPKRNVTNWQEVEDTVASVVSSRGYSIAFHDFVNVSLSDQVLILSRATVFVSSHGAGMTHMIWMNPKSIVIEIISASNPRLFFPALAADFDLQLYQYVEHNVIGDFDQDSSIRLNVNSFIHQLSEALWLSDQQFGIAPGCHNPYQMKDFL